VALAFAGSAGIYAIGQERNARRAALAADASRLGALARANTDYDRSLLLAAQAVTLNPSPTTESDLFAVLLGGETGPKVATPKVLVDIWKEAAAQRLQQALDEALGGVPTDLSVRLHVIRGHPDKVLTRLAHRRDDLLVIGAGSTGAIRRRLHPTVGDHCTTHADCPVMLAPPPALASALGTLRTALAAPSIGAALDVDRGASPECSIGTATAQKMQQCRAMTAADPSRPASPPTRPGPASP
jgi:nucleotide-binding universal stress UspA family protein